MIKSNNISFLALLCISTMFLAPVANAYKVQPMVAEMAPIGKKAQLSLRLENNDSESLTVEMVPLKLILNASGQVEYIPADDDLLIIPVTAVLKPGRSQAVMVRYLGQPDITQSEAYSVGFRQIPVNIEGQESSQVSMAVNFNTLINVVPANAKPNLAVEKMILKDGQWHITINNSGNSYTRLSHTQWLVSDGVTSVKLNKEKLAELVSGNLFLPNSSRTLTIKPIEKLSMDNLDIKINIMK
ncbi:MAG: fimbrial chaperone protein [Oceanospirillaceae bacterium]|jgi:fimbrial chaperone protein